MWIVSEYALIRTGAFFLSSSRGVTKLKKPISFETTFGTYVADRLGEGASKRLGFLGRFLILAAD